jgi:WD40 repeat protein
MGDSADVFASYSTPDQGAVEEILNGLGALGVRVWFDKWNIRGGDDYIKRITEALEDTGAIAVFIGQETMRPWQTTEVEAAIKLDIDSQSSKRVIPVLISGSSVGNIPPLLNLRSAIRFPTTTDKESLRLLKCAIEGVEPGPDPDRVPFFGERPFRGLKAFDVSDARFFAGRDAVVEQLASMVEQVFGSGAPKLVGIVGDSGSGKSSLARAGLIPALLEGRVKRAPAWKYVALKPGMRPLNSLAIAFAGPEPKASEVDRLRDGLDASPTKLALLAGAHAGPTGYLALLVDQFEETFSLCPNEQERQKFIAALMDTCSVPDCRTLVIVTLRADFYGACGHGNYGDFRTVLNRQHILVGSMSAEELRSAIREPAVRAGYEAENGLIDILIKDTLDQRGALPLLQFTLDELWRARAGRRLTLEAYQRMNGLSGALNQRADELYRALHPQQQAMLKRLLLRLVQIGEDGRYLRTRVPLPQLLPGVPNSDEANAVRALLNRLTGQEYRLVTMTATISADGDGPPFVEVTHEALIRNWNKFREWVEDPKNREFLAWRKRFLALVSEWRDNNRDPDTQLRGARLRQALDWLRERRDDFAREEIEFIEASRAGDEAGRAAAVEEQRKKRRERAIVWGLISAVALATVGVVFLFVQRPRVDKRLEIAAQLLPSNPRFSMSVALRAHAARPSPETTALVEQALQESTEAPIEPTGEVTSVEFSTAGDKIATGADDGTACVWALNGTRLFCTGGGQDGVQAVALLDGDRLATVTTSGRFSVFSDSGRHADSELDLKMPIEAAACAQDATCAVVSGGRACLWRPDRPAPDPCFDTPVSKPLAVAMWAPPRAPGTLKIAVVGEGPDGQIVGGPSGKSIPISIPEGMVRSVSFDAAGTVLLAAPRAGPARLWDANSGAAIGEPIRPRGQPMLAAALSADGTRIISSNADGSVSVWDIKARDTSLLIPGSNRKVRTISVDANLRHAAMGLPGGKVRIYDLNAGSAQLRACEQEKQFRAEQSNWLDECAKYIDRSGCEATCDSLPRPGNKL